MAELYFTPRFAIACKARFNRQQRIVVDWQRRRTPSELVGREPDYKGPPRWDVFPSEFVEVTLEQILLCGPLEATLIAATARSSVTWLEQAIHDAQSGAVRGDMAAMDLLRARCDTYNAYHGVRV